MKTEGRYDKLFDMFNYMREHAEGIHHYYPMALKMKKMTKNRVSKDSSRQSSGSRQLSGSSKLSKNKSRHSSQSERSKSKEKTDFFRKKTNKEKDLYTGFGLGRLVDKERANISIKSSSKKKDPVKSKRGSSK